MREWISVKDRLPDYIETVIIVDDKGNMEFAYISSGEWMGFDYFDEALKPTHWMPLPEPPKEQS